MVKTLRSLCALSLLMAAGHASAQTPVPFTVNGNFQLDAQYYIADSLIGAPVVPEKVLSNGFGNLIVSRDKFSAGMRYESYLNPILGFDSRYKGSGITYRYLTYTADQLEVTLGNFYDQFGSGLIFRSYEERGLGIDNAMDGVRLRYNPHPGIYIKGLVGEQRFYFEKGPGLVRGADGEIALSEAIGSFAEWKTRITLGGSVVSKYQKSTDPRYKIPENVLAFASRMNLNRGGFQFYGEYAYKYNDPSLINATAENPSGIFKPGEAVYLNGVYSTSGLGFSLSAKYIDNMGCRSGRDDTINELNLSYLPALTKQQTYRLATLYPYATQPNGEAGIQAELFYNFKKGSLLGGSNGTYTAINYSRANGIKKSPLRDELGYESDFFSTWSDIAGNPETNKYFEEVNLEIQKKITRDFKLTLNYIYTSYDKGVILGLGDAFGIIYAHTGIAEIQYKINKNHSIRTELQHLFTGQDKQNWAMALIEYAVSPHWFFAVFDEYNYGNNNTDERYHYPNVSFGYTRSANRIMLGYGKQREGLLCVGGVCRNVPASNGFSLSVTSSF